MSLLTYLAGQIIMMDNFIHYKVKIKCVDYKKKSNVWRTCYLHRAIYCSSS